MDTRGRPFIEVSKTVNVSRTGALLTGVPAKLAVGDTVGLTCNGKKYRFRVVWTGAEGTSEAGNVGLQCLESGKWIWDGLRLPMDDIDVYTRPPEAERRLINRVRCFLSAEVVCERAGQKILVFVRDLSLGGCYVATTFPFPTESNVSLAMWVDDQTKIWVDGIVISSHPGIGMGVKFLGLRRQTLEAVERCISQLAGEESSPVRIWLPPDQQR